MKVLRFLVCLLVTVALAAPPLAAQATPQAHSAGMDCHGQGHDRDHHDDHAKHVSHSCCPSMNGSVAVSGTAEIERAVQQIDRSPRASFVLSGLVPVKDPPPPRV